MLPKVIDRRRSIGRTQVYQHTHTLLTTGAVELMTGTGVCFKLDDGKVKTSLDA